MLSEGFDKEKMYISIADYLFTTSKEALSKEAFVEMLKLQDKMNSVVNPNWLEDRSVDDWAVAILQELSELRDHMGWKWWKKQEPNIPQAQMEVVDIWHFKLSMLMNGVYNGLDLVNANYYLLPSNEFNNYLAIITDRLIVNSHLFSTDDITRFNGLLEYTGLTWEELHSLYLVKNVLNIFRQDNGYKEGTYVKEWFGKEDNEIVMEHVDGLIEQGKQLTGDLLYTELQLVYTRVIEGDVEAVG